MENNMPNPAQARKHLTYILMFVMLSLLFSGCSGTDKLDEAMMYEGAQFQLKLVRYYENLPLHYTGEIYRVQCKSAQTVNSPANKTQEAGWVTLGGGGAIGSKHARELVERDRPFYKVMDEQTLVWLGSGVNVSFNACGVFRGWHPTALPLEWITPVEKPDYCAPKGTGDCRHYDFMGDNMPRYEAVTVAPEGRISFIMHSRAVRNEKSVYVHSEDYGKTWQTKLITQ